MHPEKSSYVFLGSFLSTVFLLQWWSLAVYPLWVWVFLCATTLHIIVLRWKTRVLLIGIAGVALALSIVTLNAHVTTPTTLDYYATNETITIRGVIADEPDRRPMQTKYTVEADEIILQSVVGVHEPQLRKEDNKNSAVADRDLLLRKKVTGKVLVTDRRGWPHFQYGDEVEVHGILEKPGVIESFHYDQYLSRFGIESVMYYADFTLLSSGNGNPLFAKLFEFKERFEAQINRLYGEPHASFLAGLLTGSRRGIPKHLLQDFNRTGLTHIIAISGYNITIIIVIISAMLLWLPLQWRFIPAVIAIIAFTFFVGASAAVVRASIMGILGLLAVHLGRRSHTRLAILWTLFFMAAWNPKMLWYDAGFQLSFLSVVGLNEIGPLLKRWMQWVPEFLGMREALHMTIAAQIATAPLIIILFQRFSLIAPIANILTAPAIPLAMLFGFLGTTLSYIWFPLGQVFAFLGWGFLEWIIVVAKTVATVPFASIDTPKFGVIFALFYCTGLLVWIFWSARSKSTTTRTQKSSYDAVHPSRQFL